MWLLEFGFFHIASSISVYLPSICLCVHNSCPIFLLGCFLIIKIWDFFICSGYKLLIRYTFCKYLLLHFGLSFHLSDVFWGMVFNFDELQFIIFLLFWMVFLGSYVRNLGLNNITKIFFSPKFSPGSLTVLGFIFRLMIHLKNIFF